MYIIKELIFTVFLCHGLLWYPVLQYPGCDLLLKLINIIYGSKPGLANWVMVFFWLLLLFFFLLCNETLLQKCFST